MNKLYSILSLLFLCATFHSAIAQDPTISPEFFSATDEITITYDVTGTALSSLNEAFIWMWLPELSEDAPSNINPASSNSNATNPAKFEKVNENGRTLFRIQLTPTTFYSKSAEEITEIGMLLKGNDWSDGQTSDFYTSVSQGFAVNLNSPTGNYGFYAENDIIPIEISASETATFQFYLDGNLVDEENGITQYSNEHTVISDGIAHKLSFIVSNNTTEKTFNYSYIVNPTTENQPTPAGLKAGINYSEDHSSVHLVLVAPNKESIFVIGEFNNWGLDDAYLMKKDGNQFWIKIENLIAGQEYQFQYLVDGEIKIADPYSEKIGSEFDDPEIINDNRYPNLKPYPHGETSEAVGYIHTNKPEFPWTDESYQRPKKEDLVIYELLVRDFTDLRTYNAVTDKLDYLESLGINAIEFMPVMEFEGNLSWGYNPFAMTALDKYYGTEYDFKTLVNEAHNRGIAIILDIALNHQFGRNSLVRLYNQPLYGNPTAANPWFNTSPRHDFNVGYDMNHESQFTKDYVDRVVAYWIEEYHVDGYRYDLSKGFTQKNTLGNVGAWGQYDASRVALLKRMADVQWSVDPESYVILEHFAENNEERELSNYGMMLWGNENHNFRNLAKGNNANVSGLSYLAKGWNDPHVIGYMESHDEERVAWDLKQNSSASLAQQMQRLKLNAALFFMVPGPKMLWQFGEFGYDEELNNDRLGVKPTRWEYLDDPERNKLFQVYQSMIKLKTQTGILDKENFQWSASSEVKWIRYDNENTQIAFIGNFGKGLNIFDQLILEPGTWYDYFSGDEVEVSNEFSLRLASGQFKILTSEPIDNFIEGDESVVLSNDKKTDNLSLAIIYPNPVLNSFYIKADLHISDVQVFDLKGNQMNVRISKSDKNRLKVDFSEEATGLYLVNYKEGNVPRQQKILKH